MLVTFLRQAAAHTGFVADVDSLGGKIRLADTGHAMEQWSLARWDDLWPQTSSVTESEVAAPPVTDPSQTRNPFFGHGAHKILPGFNLMYAKWPSADWYIMIDDDTFLFRRALMRLVSSLDPEDKHYIGYPHHGTHMCRDPTASWHKEPGTPFALGGCGIVLSRGALKQLAPNIPGCVVASQDCHLDDVRLFFCLRDIGIPLGTSLNYPAMNFAPNSNIDWARLDPCVQPVVFHGVSLNTAIPSCTDKVA